MNRWRQKAQAVTELAIFGAILIFVIGSILRNAVDAGMMQNQSLKAMRWAMLQSYHGVRNVNKSRDSASVIFVEDRLAPDAGKVGSLERTPVVQAASGMFSNTLFMPLDWLEYHNIPVTDLFVNGIHFTMSTARFIVYDVRLVGDGVRVWDLTNNIVYPPYPKNGNWKDNCLDDGAGGFLGCPLFYTLIGANSKEFCVTAPCSDDPSTLDVITLDQRFDLNRNNNYNDDPQGATRPRMFWQWGAVKGLKDKIPIDTENGGFPAFDIDADRKEETIYAVNPESLWHKTGGAYDVQQGSEPIVHPDVDMAALEAASSVGIVLQDVFDIDGNVIGQVEVFVDNRTVVQQLYVLDGQKGDIDSGYDDTDRLTSGQPSLDRGMLRETSVYTETRNGTYLEINEGKAFVPSFSGASEFVRSTSKKDQIDVITRMFQLDNNTGRFCGTISGTRWVTIGNVPGGLPNPAQYCVDTALFPGANCFTPATVSVTCYDAGTKMLFIRSRIEDQGGRKWVTQTK